MIMTNIRKIRKAYKCKNGIKTIRIHFKTKSDFTPTMCKMLRQSTTELLRKNI